MNELKQELELDVHRVPLDELCKRFGTNLESGLSKGGALEGFKKYGEWDLSMIFLKEAFI